MRPVTKKTAPLNTSTFCKLPLFAYLSPSFFLYSSQSRDCLIPERDKVLPLLSPKDLAAMLGIAEQTIYNRHSGGGDLPPCLKLGRLLRFQRDDVEKWLQRKLTPSTSVSLANVEDPPRRRGRPTIAEHLAASRRSPK